jgi:hypothetical protein
MLHVCGKVDRQHVHIWGTENPHATMEHVHDSPKVNVFCAISSCKVSGPFFLVEPTVTGINWLDMLQLWLMPQLQEGSKDLFSNKTDPRHTYILTSVLTSLLIFPVVGLGALLTMTLLFFPGHHSHLRLFLMGLHQGSCVYATYAM